MVDTKGPFQIVRLPRVPRVVNATAAFMYRGPVAFRYAHPEIVTRRQSDDPAVLYDGYKDDVVSNRILRFLERRYPEHAKVYEIGRSTQGRPLLALKISDNVAVDEDEPSFLFNGAHHGNEPLTPDFPIDLATVLLGALDGPEDRLLPRVKSEFVEAHFREMFGGLKRRYQSETLETYVREFEIWIVPVVNPDGLSAYWNRDVSMGRKNGRDTAPPIGRIDRRDGVDLNRNYPFYWKSTNNAASSDRPDNYYYRGPSAASEPETRAMMALAERERFVMAFSFHSWATKVLVPYTIDEVMNPFPHVAQKIGEDLARAAVSFQPAKDYVADRNLYPVDGTDEDWLHFKFGTMAFIIESSYHTPDYGTLGRKCIQGLRSLSLRALELYRRGPVLTVHVRDEPSEVERRLADFEKRPAIGSPREGMRVRIKEFAYFEGETFTTDRHGRIDFFLPEPGQFTVEASKDRRNKKTRRVRCDGGVCRLQITLTGP